MSSENELISGVTKLERLESENNYASRFFSLLFNNCYDR